MQATSLPTITADLASTSSTSRSRSVAWPLGSQSAAKASSVDTVNGKIGLRVPLDVIKANSTTSRCAGNPRT